jgi:ubiquinone/menaquinone biosynthesis C-methylase UbiE
MGFYSRFIFPWLCDFLLDQPLIAEQRRQLLSGAAGDVLEIGFGSGLNLPHYSTTVQHLTAVDPNPGMQQRAARRVKRSDINVDLLETSGEQLPVGDNSIDCVVTTFTLCSVADPTKTLTEIRRVLKPDGRFLFLEHGLSPEPEVQKRQRRLNWLQGIVGDGCQLDRNMKELVGAQSFSSLNVDEHYLEKMPKTHAYIYRGMATK